MIFFPRLNPNTLQTEAAPATRAWLGFVALAAAAWLVALNQLRVDWSINPQYSYGWGVPLLALYLLAKRWTDRPDPAPPAHPGTTWLLTALAALAWLPIRLVQEANPDWRLVSWAQVATILAFSLLLLQLAGGRPWRRHFAFPLAFLAVAVPWPSGLEDFLVQHLMQSVAAITVEALSWLGVLARQRGNLIELTTGVVGINEACSGVRSFQSTLMIALFLGELNRFRPGRRLALLGLGALLAFALNVARSFFLTWQCVQKGTSAVESWHDSAGYTVFAISFAALLGVAWLLQRGAAPGRKSGADTRAPAPPPLPGGRLIALGVWLLVVEGTVEMWYRAHERHATRQAQWTVRWPVESRQFKFNPLPETVRTTLRYNRGESALWRPTEQTPWQVFFFRWNPGRASAQLAKNHSPEVCLPAAGLEMTQDLGVVKLRAGPLTLPFREFVFTSRGQPLHVFYCVWEDRVAGAAAGPEDFTAASRLRAAWQGRRHLGQQVLEVAMHGYAGPEEARRGLEAGLQQLIGRPGQDE